MHCLCFICERKFYTRTHVKITQHWKSNQSPKVKLSVSVLPWNRVRALGKQQTLYTIPAIFTRAKRITGYRRCNVVSQGPKSSDTKNSVDFVYSRQQKMDKYFSKRGKRQIKSASDQCYFLDAVATVGGYHE